MKKLNISFAFLSLTVFFLIQGLSVGSAYGVEKGAQDAILRAQKTIKVLEEGIAHAEEVLQQIKKRGTRNEYQRALEIKQEAERMLAEASKHIADAKNIAGEFNSAPTDTVADAVSYSSRAKAETAWIYAKIGLIFLEALQFAADGEFDCTEEMNVALQDRQETWSTMKKIVELADKSLVHTRSALTLQATAADEAAKGIEAAKQCIALARDLNLRLENIEDICNDFIKKWRDYKDQEDDEDPSPV